jgi:predicted small secreted protein
MEPFAIRSVGSADVSRRTYMFQKIMTVALIGAALATAACNTVRGAARDVNSVANTADNAI